MAYNTIVLIGDLYEVSEEAKAGGAITPGMLLAQTTTALTMPGEQPRVIAHGSAGSYAQKKFAKEKGGIGAGGTLASGGASIGGGTIDDAYASGDTVYIHEAQPGDVIYALLPASASAVILTDFLTSNGDGCLKKATSTDQRLAVPLEAVDNSANASSRARIRVKII